MMKSVALSESGVHEPGSDEDFILVVQPAAESAATVGPWELSFDRSVDDDDASYDHCEDAYSIYSAPQSLAIDSNALESFQTDFFGRPGETSSTFSPFDGEPEILRHGISSLAVEPALVQEALDRSAAASEPPEADHLVAHPFAASLLDSSLSGTSGALASSAATKSSSESSLFPDPEQPLPTDRTESSVPPGDDRLPIDDDDEDPSSSSGTDDNKADPALGGSAAPDSVSSAKAASRLCNKKRRKQLKLARKAAAAAAAAAALTHLGGMVQHSASPAASRTSSANAKNGAKQLKRQASAASSASKNRKQVANIAVACATESLARYREECLQKSQK